MNAGSQSIRSFAAQAEAVKELLKLLPTAKHIRPSEKNEIKIRAEKAIETLLKQDERLRS